jgi:uncharacterized protein involved in response to NO
MPGRRFDNVPTLLQPFALHWQRFSSAPHRMLFLGGVLQLVVVMGWWAAVLAARLGAPWLAQPLLAPTMVHAWLMVYGVFPFFILGFLFTVYPRWRGQPPIARTTYVTTFLALVLGGLLVYLGLYVHRALVAAGVALFLAGLGVAVTTLYRVSGRPGWRDPHLRMLNLALAVALPGSAAYLGYTLTDNLLAYRLARDAGLWLFLVPIVFAVSHRMIPVFSQGVLMNYLIARPVWGLPLVVACCLGHAALELAELPQWRFLADGPLAAAALHHSWLWQFRRSFHARLLAMLHIAFLWLGIALALYTLQSLTLLATGVDHLGRAPLHALGIGLLAGMVVAMASRVTLGHSGRALLADALTWTALLGVNLAALVRIAAEFWPAAFTVLNLLAALLWLAFVGAWAVRYLPLYLQPRADNQPG